MVKVRLDRLKAFALAVSAGLIFTAMAAIFQQTAKRAVEPMSELGIAIHQQIRNFASIYRSEYSHAQSNLEERFGYLLQNRRSELIGRISGNEKLFVFLQGRMDINGWAFVAQETQITLDRILLTRNFRKAGYEVFHIYRNKSHFRELIELIKLHATKEHDLVVFYTGHGTERGLELDVNTDLIRASDLAQCFEGFSGSGVLILNTCYSGDIASRLMRENLPIAIVSASRLGSKLKTADIGSPSFLTMDLLKAGMNLAKLGKNIRPKPSAGYVPRVYE